MHTEQKVTTVMSLLTTLKSTSQDVAMK